MKEGTRSEENDCDCKPCAPEEDLRAYRERERWLRDRLDRERTENLLLLRYLSARRESGPMRFWRWLIGDTGPEEGFENTAGCSCRTEQPPLSGKQDRLKKQIRLWLAHFANRFRNKGREDDE